MNAINLDAAHFKPFDGFRRALQFAYDAIAPTTVEPEVAKVTRQISFSEFVREAWHVVEPTTKFEDNWHIDAIGVLLTKVEAGEITRAVINLPPRHMKSLLVSVFWPCWLWTRQPGLRFMFGSYSDSLSRKHSVDRRTIIESEWYQTHWGHIVTLTKDTNRQDEFVNTMRGHMIATSVGGSSTGKGADIIVVDDPQNPEGADSDAERLTSLKWFNRTIGTRLDNDRGKVVVVMQRLHEDDVAGHAVKKLGYFRLKVPAIEEEPKKGEEQQVYELSNGTKVRRKIGSVLWPRRFGRAFMVERRTAMGPDGFSQQYQQEPTGKAGSVFNVDAIRKWEGPRPGTRDYERRVVARVRGWDTAATEKETADYTAGVLMAMLDDGSIVVEDVIREQLEPDEVDKIILASAEVDRRLGPAQYAIREEQEPGASGKTVVRFRARSFPPGFDYQGIRTDKKKKVRARPFASAIRMGRVYALQDAPWWDEYKEELRLFDKGVNDDQVDGSSTAYNHLGLNASGGDIEQGYGT